DEQKQRAKIAPIYDCGSCLYPQMDVRDMAKVLGDENEINQRIYTFPTSAIVDSGKKISYFDFISSLQNAECGEALERVAGRIDMEKVCEIIATTPAISDLQKDFYQTLLTKRKEKILDYSMALRMKQQENAQKNK
ncbi:MAG: CtkA family protein, partial [Lachnospiraceae bacterium]